MTTRSHKEKLMPPKGTFFNLPRAKQDRILAAAVREFAENGYRRASLNTIVQRLGIAKGSLYQYFANKEGLFLHVFDRFTDLVKEMLASQVKNGPEADFFRQIQEALLAGLRFIDNQPDFYRIYLRVLFEEDVPRRRELLGKVRLFSMEYFGGLCARAQINGIIRPDLPCPMVVFLMESVLDRFLQAYASPDHDNGLGLAALSAIDRDQAVTQTIDVLKNGLGRVKAEG
ncbi:MAG: TetR family transcriptional regulator [Deltaproteobacteria bacterium CG23_combo_of_CG06-09_8_20_14_all_60_8]|nr:MAG: TetR family transcriptional regulator [Deltaproteobacteria bacterium CG23_combo_of_CG06-09_8_20_14_all_60_8]